MDGDDKRKLGEQAYETAQKYELAYGCCPQCVLAAVQESVGGVADQTIKAAHGLSGGGALMGLGICGALSGGLVALSAKYGRDRAMFDKGRCINNFRKARELTERFQQEFGGVTCRELQQKFTGRTYDLWNADQYQAFDAARGRQCAHATGTVTRWLVEEML